SGFRGYSSVKLGSYVGVLALVSGEQIEVLPKIGCAALSANNPVESESVNTSSAASESREVFLNMLKHLGSFKHILSADSLQATRALPLHEVFIQQFLLSVGKLLKKGLRSDYVDCEDNLLYQRGRLSITQQLKHNSVSPHRFYCQYQEYLQDRPVNRVILAALNKSLTLSRNGRNQTYARELIQAFGGVGVSKDIKRDIAAIRMDRGMCYYQAALDWAKMLLLSHSPVPSAGKQGAAALLFPMELLFEAYVAHLLSLSLPANFTVKTQQQSMSLVSFGKKNWFRLKPDLTIEHRLAGTHELAMILDTKWKLLDENKNNGTEKFGLSQADFYQMFAYGQCYLRGSGDLVLFYPKTATFDSPIEQCFSFNLAINSEASKSESQDKALRLWVVPVDLSPGLDDMQRITWPSDLELPWQASDSNQHKTA
ncbi:MAG: McrC family protein, partial [Cellvibrionaceae bacterium]|nr:McrC family protein [Cellvibrionaceae bacterium]